MNNFGIRKIYIFYKKSKQIPYKKPLASKKARPKCNEILKDRPAIAI